MRTAVFDLDGTLVDTLPDIAAALQRLANSRGLAGFSLPEVAAMVGDGARVLVERGFTARGGVADAAAIDGFLMDYEKNALGESRLYPGVAEGLRGLAARGWRLAVCTNKPAAPARVLLAGLGIDAFFAAVGAGDSFAVRKPDPGHLLATLAAAGGTVAGAVMVGDHANDVVAARGAGVACVFAGWGYGPPAMAAGAVAVAGGFAELVVLLERLLPTPN